MYSHLKSLIDNWSLEHAGLLLEDRQAFSHLSNEQFINGLGGLSNYINALLLYDETNYLANGFESDWARFLQFRQTTQLNIKPIDPLSLNIDWNSDASYSDIGIKNYLQSADHLKTDLFVSPERATKIAENRLPKRNDNFRATLLKIDEEIGLQKTKSWFPNIQIGIDQNFQFPSLTHYVLSQANGTSDLLTVIQQMRESGKFQKVRHEVEQLTADQKSAGKFQNEIENMIQASFGKTARKHGSWTLNIPVLFLEFSKTINLNFFNRKKIFVAVKRRYCVQSRSKRIKKSY